MKPNRKTNTPPVEGHEPFVTLVKEIMARQNAQERLIHTLLFTLIDCLPISDRASFLKSLYALADPYKLADIGASTVDPHQRTDAADLARLSSDHLCRMVDELVATLPSGCG